MFVFVAGYQLWRDYHLRLQPKLKVSQVIPQPWHDPAMVVYNKSPMPPNNRNGDAVAYYFEIVNSSEGIPIHGIRVKLEEIIPPAPNLNWLPVTLFQKHDNIPPHAQQFDLNPQERKHIDFVSGYRGDDHFAVRHIVQGVNADVSSGRYRMRVGITANDAAAVFVWFRVFVDSGGLLQCEIEQPI